MKRMIRILVLAVAFITGLTTVSAQTVQLLATPKVPNLPSTVTSYLDDPLRYFNIQFVVNGAGSGGLDVFFDMEFTLNTNSLYIRTRPGSIPTEPLHLSEGVNIVRRDDLAPQIGNRMETNVVYNNPLDMQQLPEGTYQLCVDVYLWTDKDNPAREPISIGPCPSFDICYSGSAPELVSPLAGAQMDLYGNMVLTPARRINFFWTPVISNCTGRSNHFKYKLKVVKVVDGQNYQDAIRYNPTVFSIDVNNGTHAVFDTLRDIKVQMERGALYVAQVEAEQIRANTTMAAFVIANEGKSQPMPFFWGSTDKYVGPSLGGTDINSTVNPSRRYGYVVEEEEGKEGKASKGVAGLTLWDGGVEEVSELETFVEEMKEQYFAAFIQDTYTIDNLTETYPEERKYVPTPKRCYKLSDGYYTVPMTDDFEVSFMPARHDKMKDVSYTIELYDYMEGGVDSITAYMPLFSEQIEELPDRFSKMDSHELINRTLAGWGSNLEQGNLYYLQLSCIFTVGYWDYTIADTLFYVNEMLAEHVHDTISREFSEDELMYSNGVFFQWGDDPDVPEFKTPQWKAPVDRTGDDIYDPANYTLPTVIPEVQKGNSFPVNWVPVKNVTKGDEVTYEVNVYELKKGQTLQQAISENDVVVSRTVVDGTGIFENDPKFFKAFSPKKTYVMTLSTEVNGESDTFYHFQNGNEALPIVFKIVK